MPRKRKAKILTDLPVEETPEKSLLLEDGRYFIVVKESPDGIKSLFDINSDMNSVHSKISSSRESKSGYHFHVFLSRKVGELVPVGENSIKAAFPVFNAAAYTGSVN